MHTETQKPGQMQVLYTYPIRTVKPVQTDPRTRESSFDYGLHDRMIIFSDFIDVTPLFLRCHHVHFGFLIQAPRPCQPVLNTSYTNHKCSALMPKLPENERENVEHRGDVGMLATGRLLEVLDSLLAQRHGHLVATLRSVLDDEVVEGSQSHRNFVPGRSLTERTRLRRVHHWHRQQTVASLFPPLSVSK